MQIYQEELNYLKSFQNAHGGFVYESGTGHCLWSRDMMTEDELESHWDYVNNFVEEYSECHD